MDSLDFLFTEGVASLPEGKSRGLCKRFVESLSLVLKGERSFFLQGERFAVQLPLDCSLASRSRMLN